MKNNVKKPEYKGNLRRVEEIAEELEVKGNALKEKAKEFSYRMVLESDPVELNAINKKEVVALTDQSAYILMAAKVVRELLNHEDKQDVPELKSIEGARK